MRVQSLGREDPLEEGTATHSSILAWRIPWKEEPGGLQSTRLQLLLLLLLSHFSRVCLFMISWTLACQAPLSIGFSREEYWSGLLCPLPRDLPNPGAEPESLKFTCIGK